MKHIQLLCHTCLVSINKRKGRLPPPPQPLSCLAWMFCLRAADSEKSVFPQKAVKTSVFLPQWFFMHSIWTLHKPGSLGLLYKSYLCSIVPITKGRALDVLCGLVFAPSLWFNVKTGPNKQGDHKQRISQSKAVAKLTKTDNTTLL